MKLPYAALAALFPVIAVATNPSSEPVRLEFSGVIDEVSDPSILGDLSGQTFTGFMIFDPDAVTDAGIPPGFTLGTSVRLWRDPNGQVEVDVAGNIFLGSAPDPQDFTIVDGDTNDQWSTSAVGPALALIVFSGPPGTLNSLEFLVPSLDLLPDARLILLTGPRPGLGQGGVMSGTIQSLVVTEPPPAAPVPLLTQGASLLLLLLLLAGLSWGAVRKQSRSPRVGARSIPVPEP